MNQDINEVLAALAAKGADGQIVVNVFYVQHQYLTLPENAPAEAPVAKRSQPKRQKARDLWLGVPNANAKKRAARFVAAVERYDDAGRYKEINDKDARSTYDAHLSLVEDAVRCYDALRIARSGNPARPAPWDGAVVQLVLQGGAAQSELVDRCRDWALQSWTLADVGVTSANDLDGARQAISRAIAGLPFRFGQIGF